MPTDPDANSVGRKIRARMGEQRVNMSELGRRTRINRTTLAYQIDNGGVTVETLMRIAEALSLDAAELLPRSEPESVSA